MLQIHCGNSPVKPLLLAQKYYKLVKLHISSGNGPDKSSKFKYKDLRSVKHSIELDNVPVNPKLERSKPITFQSALHVTPSQLQYEVSVAQFEAFYHEAPPFVSYISNNASSYVVHYYKVDMNNI